MERISPYFKLSVVGSCLIVNSLFAGTDPALQFGENRSQWPAQVRYMADLNGGRLWLENDRFTFSYYSIDDVNRVHEQSENSKSTTELNNLQQSVIRAHAYSVQFDGALSSVQLSATGQYAGYWNYLVGNDMSKWASYVHHYNTVDYTGLYTGIDMKVYSQGTSLKYDYIVAANADPSVIRMRYSGADNLQLVNGNLVIHTSVNTITEEKPFAYQEINGEKRAVRCRFTLKNGVVGFEFLQDYNHYQPLIIDPIVVASTYSGSTAMTYGHCATYDDSGNIYTGGRCFGQGYPASVGAFQTIFGGNVDIAISKLDPNGSNLLWATYIGGSNDEYSHSLISNTAGELYIYGSTASSNYPTTAGCYDNTFNSSGFGYDIIVTRLNSTGTGLMGSTYVGGSGNDGNNALWNHYGDTYRGEIVLDAAGNAYINSFTQSNDFPVTASAYDQTWNGLQDACIFKMDPLMTNLIFSTFLGGSNDDAGFGIRLDSNGDLVVCGGTASNDFPVTVGVYQNTYQGGQYDGWVARLVLNANILLVSSYFGTSALDEAYFIDLDPSNNIYIYGQADGVAPVTAGVFSVPGSTMFISKFDPVFSSIIYSTVIGDGTTFSSLSPSAFMVDVCENVYISGFGAQNGYPVSANALYSTSAVGTCYLAVLKKNAVSLLFGTFYGGWHVDGGTSRFDPQGIVYQGVCQGGPGFPTTAWAWNNGAAAPSWDIVVFKIDFQTQGVNAVASAAPSDSGCAPFSVTFANTSTGLNYLWDYGDGSPTDTTTAPTHVFTTPGTYDVVLIAYDSTACLTSDTTHITITVLAPPIVNLGLDTVLCGTPNVQLDAGNPGLTYLWSTNAVTQQITASTAGLYWVTVDNGLCTTTDSVNVTIVSSPGLSTDTTVCQGNPVTLDALNVGSTYNWSNGLHTQQITVTNPGTYWVQVINGSCTLSDSIDVFVNPLPVVNLGNDTVLCPGSLLLLDAGNPGSTYLWSSGAVTQTFTPPLNNNLPAVHSVTVTDANGCQGRDSMEISYMRQLTLGNDATLCDQPSLTLDATTPNATYNWSTGETTPTIQVQNSGLYWVETTLGTCTQRDTMNVTGYFGGTSLYIPNTFTPNHDGLNDRFLAYGDGIITFDMKIFNRWGELIFETADPAWGWDGQYKGKLVENDVYVYVVKFTSLCTGNAQVRQIGHVLVRR